MNLKYIINAEKVTIILFVVNKLTSYSTDLQYYLITK